MSNLDGFDDMTLISLIDGNNIDFVENNVSNLGDYKERLRENPKNFWILDSHIKIV